jgi:predicted transcriptional regulator of viral defense system
MKYKEAIMARQVLNDTQRAFLEEVIIEHGTVVSYEQLSEHIPYQDEAAKRRFVSQLTRAGWLVRIKKGLYQLSMSIRNVHG